jgi:hypothetical protein
MSFPLTPASPFSPFVTVIPSVVLNAWRTSINEAVDGTGGGNYTPSAQIHIGAAGLKLSGSTALELDGTSVTTTDSGSAFNVNGTVTIKSGGAFVTVSGATATFSGSTLFVGDCTFDGPVVLNSTVEMTGSGGFTFDLGSSLLIGANTRFTNSGPAPTASPGVNDAISGANVPKMWAMIYTSGGGSTTVTIGDGYNVASAAVNSGNHARIDVAFALPMLNSNYAVCITGMDGSNYLPSAFNTTVNGFEIFLWNAAAGTSIDLTGGVYHFGIQVFARQS